MALSDRAGGLSLGVVLADPRIPNPYHPDGRESERDRRDLERLRETLADLPGIRDVTYLTEHERLPALLETRAFDLTLNFCNAGYRNLAELQMHVPALLEMLEVPFAGADGACLCICHDKAGMYAAAAAQGIPVPRHELLRVGGHPATLPTQYPALLKPNDGSGSEGISTRSLVHDEHGAAARLRELEHERVPPKWVLADRFLAGRELTVGVLEGPDGARCLPALEIGFERLGAAQPPIMTHESKADERSDYWQLIDVRPAELPAAMQADIEHHCGVMFDRLGCRDYARFDFRCDEAGVPHLIDANAHPEWGAESLMAEMARLAGLGYGDFLEHIITSARRRASRRPARRESGSGPDLRAGGVRLRPTQPADLAFVSAAECAPENRPFIEQWSRAEHAACIEAPRSQHLIIEDDRGEPAGYVILEGLDSSDRALLLRRIVVTRKGAGLGRAAMGAIERYCFEDLAFRRLWLEVDAGNAVARHLYEGRGFRPEGEHTMVRMALERPGIGPG